MAQGNLIQGQSSGKLGDVVLMVRKGKQVARVYTTSGARSGDAASEAARYQRVRFGAASNEWNLYRYVCTGMYRKGIKTNQSDYNYFVKRNIQNLPFLTKEENSSSIHVVMPGQYSEGNLGMIEVLFQHTVSSPDNLNVVKYSDITAQNYTNVKWTDTVESLKAAFRKIYINATKITYVISNVREIEIDTDASKSKSQYVSRYVVKFDLYNEIETGENAKTVIQYFNDKISDENIKNLFSNQKDYILFTDSRYFRVQAYSEEENSVVDSISALIFATNDNVSDCYTTVLPAENVRNAGAFTAWYGYRTYEALINAAQSYGYKTGTMRDDIAKVTDTAEFVLNRYVEKLSTVDAAAAASLQAEIAEAGATVIKSSRKKIEPAEQA